MDETNKVKYEQLQGKLDNDLREWVKKDPIAARAILERRKQLKEMSPEKRSLSIMRAALRTAREKRKHDLRAMDATVDARTQSDYEAGLGRSKSTREILKAASDRNMLMKEALTKRNGEQIVIERSIVKDREPYQKRPTTRAIKKHREKSRGVSL